MNPLQVWLAHHQAVTVAAGLTFAYLAGALTGGFWQWMHDRRRVDDAETAVVLAETEAAYQRRLIARLQRDVDYTAARRRGLSTVDAYQRAEEAALLRRLEQEMRDTT